MIKNLVFDLDGTLVNIFDPLLSALNTMGYKIKAEDVTQFNIEDCTDVHPEDLTHVIDGVLQRDDLRTYDAAGEVMEYAFMNGEQRCVRIVTNRKMMHIEATHRLLDRICRHPFCLCVNFRSYPKSVYLGKGDALVEDRRKNALEAANHGHQVFLLNRPWNKLESPHPNIHVIYGLYELKGVLGG